MSDRVKFLMMKNELLGALLFRQIVDHAYKNGFILNSRLTDGQVERKDGPVRSQPGEFATDADDPTHFCLTVARQIAVVRIGKRRWHQR